MSCTQNSPTAVNELNLSFDGLIALYKSYFSLLPNTRQGLNTTYSMPDAALSAFSVFFMQKPSFLAHQRLLNKKHNKSNAKSLFTIDKLPSDNQIRNVLDPVKPECLTPLFDTLYQALHKQGYLEDYRGINQALLVAHDGTQQLSSKKIHCVNCSTQKHTNGEVTYSHKVITPVIVAPDKSRVISLAPEFIVPQDGHDKQDSEHAASKRWLEKHGQKLTQQGGVTILGDDLYAHQPQCESIQSQNMHFILTCKENSHATLYEWVHELSNMGKVISVDTKTRHGRRTFTHHYRFVNAVPIRDGEDALIVNWCELTTKDEKGDIQYYSAFITDHLINQDNVEEIVSNGRARWHIENGNNNTLKTKGYHLTHNFGHGKHFLASTLLSLNVLAFLFHTILELNDARYRAIRKELPSRKMFFQSIQTLTTFMVFDNWQAMMEFMMDGLELKIIDSS